MHPDCLFGPLFLIPSRAPSPNRVPLLGLLSHSKGASWRRCACSQPLLVFGGLQVGASKIDITPPLASR